MNVIFPLVTVPVVSRILLSSGLGKVNYAFNIVGWFTLFAALGIPRYGIREVAKQKANQSELNKCFSEIFLINTFPVYLNLINPMEKHQAWKGGCYVTKKKRD